MKKLMILIVILTPSLVFAQSAKKGDFSFSLSGQGGFYSTTLTTEILGVTLSGKDTAAAVFAPFTAEYMISDRIGLGLAYKSGRYLEDNDSETNQTSSFGVTMSYHFVATEKNNLFGRIALGNAIIDSQDTSPPSEDLRASGGAFGIGMHFRHYFGETFGMNFGLDYVSYKFNITNYSREGVEFDVNDVNWEMRVVGPELSAGICLKI